MKTVWKHSSRCRKRNNQTCVFIKSLNYDRRPFEGFPFSILFIPDIDSKRNPPNMSLAIKALHSFVVDLLLNSIPIIKIILHLFCKQKYRPKDSTFIFYRLLPSHRLEGRASPKAITLICLQYCLQIYRQ